MIPYGRQHIDEDDIRAVSEVLRSDFLTQGPAVEAFEAAFAKKVGTEFAVAVNSGTAALHASMVALGIGPGDEVIVPPITFTATANCVLFTGATPVFADVTESGHIDPNEVERHITTRTKAVIAVDYAGWPCDYSRLIPVCEEHGLALVCDACHALGAVWNGRPVGAIGRLNTFSFHPVKHIATGEGGMVTTDDAELAEAIREFRTHGITKDAVRFKGLAPGAGTKPSVSSSADQPIMGVTADPLVEVGPWHYEMQALGFNYRMPDLNAALGISQLARLGRFVARRRDIASRYGQGLAGLSSVTLPPSDLTPRTPNPASRIPPPASRHAFHLYPLRIDFPAIGKKRARVMQELRDLGIGTQVHYIPVCLQPYYQDCLGLKPGMYPRAEAFFAGQLSIPMFPAMSDSDVETVIRGLHQILGSGKKGPS